MNDDETRPGGTAVSPPSDAARRALSEAEARRAARAAEDRPRPREVDGRNGPEPVRYGDWEKNGIAHDF